jgi:hypothetical protein
MNHLLSMPPVTGSISCGALERLESPPKKRLRYRPITTKGGKRFISLRDRFNKYFEQEQSQLASLSTDEIRLICKEFLKVRELFVSTPELHPEKLNVSVTSDKSLHFTMVYNLIVMLFIEIFVNEDGTMDYFTMISKNKEVVFESAKHISNHVDEVISVIK